MLPSINTSFYCSLELLSNDVPLQNLIWNMYVRSYAFTRVYTCLRGQGCDWNDFSGKPNCVSKDSIVCYYGQSRYVPGMFNDLRSFRNDRYMPVHKTWKFCCFYIFRYRKLWKFHEFIKSTWDLNLNDLNFNFFLRKMWYYQKFWILFNEFFVRVQQILRKPAHSVPLCIPGYVIASLCVCRITRILTKIW